MLQKVSKYSKRGHKSLSYTEYWSRLPSRHLFILSPSTYAVLDPLLPSNSLHAPRGTMLEMLGRSSNQFSAWHTGRRTSLISPPTRSTGSGRLRGTCPSRALQPTRPWLLSSCPTPCMHTEGQCSRWCVACPTSSLHVILVQGACETDPLPILSPLACATVAHLFPSSSLPRTRKDSARDAGFPSSSLPRTRKDGTRDAGFLSPPTRTTHDACTCTLMLNNSVALSASACQVSLH